MSWSNKVNVGPSLLTETTFPLIQRTENRNIFHSEASMSGAFWYTRFTSRSFDLLSLELPRAQRYLSHGDKNGL